MSECGDVVKEEKVEETGHQYFLAVDDFIYPGEKLTLFITVLALLVITFVLAGITLGWFLVGVLGIVFWTKVQQGGHLGHCVKVTKHQFTDIHELVTLAANRLSVKVPDVFVKQDPTLNAYTMGLFGRECVVLHSSLVEALTDEELLSIIGHELTHLKCHHTKWTAFISGSPTAIPLVSDLFSLLFLYWERKAEHTCDRGGLLCTRNIKADVSALAKLAIGEKLFEKLDIEQFMSQKLDYDKELFPKIAELLGAHPNLLNRINELRRFHASEQYAQLTGDKESLASNHLIYENRSITTSQDVNKAASVVWVNTIKLIDALAIFFGMILLSFSNVFGIFKATERGDIGILIALFFSSGAIYGLVTIIHKAIKSYLKRSGIDHKWAHGWFLHLRDIWLIANIALFSFGIYIVIFSGKSGTVYTLN